MVMPQRIKKMFPLANGKYWRCQREEAGYMNMRWGCSQLIDFWYKVRSKLNFRKSQEGSLHNLLG